MSLNRTLYPELLVPQSRPLTPLYLLANWNYGKVFASIILSPALRHRKFSAYFPRDEKVVPSCISNFVAQKSNHSPPPVNKGTKFHAPILAGDPIFGRKSIAPVNVSGGGGTQIWVIIEKKYNLGSKEPRESFQKIWGIRKFQSILEK